jgi:hypothetical protein
MADVGSAETGTVGESAQLEHILYRTVPGDRWRSVYVAISNRLDARSAVDRGVALRSWWSRFVDRMRHRVALDSDVRWDG